MYVQEHVPYAANFHCEGKIRPLDIQKTPQKNKSRAGHGFRPCPEATGDWIFHRGARGWRREEGALGGSPLDPPTPTVPHPCPAWFLSPPNPCPTWLHPLPRP